MTHTVALIQARMSSTRFPGKVLAELGGQPMIKFMVDRVARAGSVDEVIVVTSDDPSDDPLAEFADTAGIALIRGPLDDVLARYRLGAEQVDADIVIRLTGDCPFADPAIIDKVVAARAAADADYASNIDPPSFADGFDVECFTRGALDRAAAGAQSEFDREHVTSWIRHPANGLSQVNVAALCASDHLRVTIDYPDDLTVAGAIVDELGSSAAMADYFDILRVLDRNPFLREINLHQRNETLKA